MCGQRDNTQRDKTLATGALQRMLLLRRRESLFPTDAFAAEVARGHHHGADALYRPAPPFLRDTTRSVFTAPVARRQPPAHAEIDNRLIVAARTPASALRRTKPGADTAPVPSFEPEATLDTADN